MATDSSVRLTRMHFHSIAALDEVCYLRRDPASLSAVNSHQPEGRPGLTNLLGARPVRHANFSSIGHLSASFEGGSCAACDT